ncbi:methylated-DNA-[protein]-cysteine S-methyltransferase [Nakamurella sp. UYEF19]|uniref:methylated-DNA--[protein]-cysteine S-methyltransferase n=1 Tax=Nakamurella sp. UYEF19 TaxID=1756392 RepID=UPI003393D704
MTRAMRAADGRAGSMDGEHAPDAVALLDTPVGRLTIFVSDVGVAAIAWGDRQSHPSVGREPARGVPVVDPQRTRPAVEQLTAYFDGDLTEFDLVLDLRGVTTTSRKVLETLCEKTPYGSSVTYGELAHSSNTGVPARGIGSIMGSNPVPIVVPCHRVLASTGLGGYSGGNSGDGLRTKRWLLTLEGVLQPTLDWIDPRLTGRSDG